MGGGVSGSVMGCYMGEEGYQACVTLLKSPIIRTRQITPK